MKIRKWFSKQSCAFVLGFLDQLKEYSSTPSNVVEAINIVIEFLVNKYWR